MWMAIWPMGSPAGFPPARRETRGYKGGERIGGTGASAAFPATAVGRSHKEGKRCFVAALLRSVGAGKTRKFGSRGRMWMGHLAGSGSPTRVDFRSRRAPEDASGIGPLAAFPATAVGRSYKEVLGSAGCEMNRT